MALMITIFYKSGMYVPFYNSFEYFPLLFLSIFLLQIFEIMSLILLYYFLEHIKNILDHIA